jgi:hypothetical protein
MSKRSFPLPRIDQIIYATSGSDLLCFLEAYSSSYQIPMSREDEEHTAFIIVDGLFWYVSMPYGLKNSLPTFVHAPKDSTSSASRYIFSFSMLLVGGCSSSALSSTPWFPGCYCSSIGEPRARGSQGPLALSQKVPPPVMRVEACRAVTPGAVAHFKVSADQRADNRCPCMRCGECEPSII